MTGSSVSNSTASGSTIRQQTSRPWKSLSDVLSVLLIIGGDVVKKALAQASGGYFTPVSLQPVRSSIMQAKGSPRIMAETPLGRPDHPSQFCTDRRRHWRSTPHTPLDGLQRTTRAITPNRRLPHPLSLLHNESRLIIVSISLGRVPTANALPLPPHQSPQTVPAYADNSPKDYIVSSITVFYIVASFYFGLGVGRCADLTRKAALAMNITAAVIWLAMISEEDTRFTAESRWNILKIWAGTIFAYAGLSYYRPTPEQSLRFLRQALGISVLFQLASMSIQDRRGRFVNALPPCLSSGILIASIMSESNFWDRQNAPRAASTSSEPESNASRPNTPLPTTRYSNPPSPLVEPQVQTGRPPRHVGVDEMDGNARNDLHEMGDSYSSPPTPG